MIVRPARRMSSAISFGVFWRLAPSTSAIMRSRKLSPARVVTRTTISSDSTRVPPVTAERSPPDSRITGADSPVIADSSTLAMPSITSPSAGMISPAVTTTWSPTASVELGTSSIAPSASRLRAVVSARVFRSAAAWALPRPSAIASAKLAKRTVNHSQAAMLPAKTLAFEEASPKSLRKRIVANAAPSSVTNMTGLRAIRRGSSLRKLSTAAGAAILGSKMDEEACVLIGSDAPGRARGRRRGST